MKQINYVDIIFGLQWGDEGKGKISNAISKDYDIVCRWNGGPNAGHTVYINEKKYKTHIIPCGIFQNKLSVIGPNCVINVEKFYEEIEYLKSEGFNTSLVKVSPKAHIITERHLVYDKLHLKEIFGTTGQGIAPAYSDKMLRVGKLAKDYIDKKYIWDGELHGKILCEGAQSFWLDVNYGNYPYVTSSETLPYSACSLGFSPKKIRDIIGVAKIYDTKSGVDPLFPNSLWDDQDLEKIINIGAEYGSTTGRKRLANWLRLNHLVKAIKISGTNRLIINKCDVLEKVGKFKIILDNKEEGPNSIDFISFENMKDFIKSYIYQNLEEFSEIIFSGDKSKI
jgi:adenylosuccinate synthase